MSLPQTIRALRTESNNQVKVVEVPFASRPDIKELGEDEIITKTLAVGLNPTDWKHAFGPWLPEGAKFIVGCDSAGEVISVGSAVKHIKAGDLVATFVHGTASEENGAYAEYVRCNQSAAIVLPKGMDPVEGAALPIPHLTAAQCLYVRLNLPLPSKPFPVGSNYSILIWGGSTAVGHHAIQLAVLSGLTVYTTASPKNHDFLLSLGATRCFSYSDKDVVEQIKEASGGKIQYAIDCACEKGSTDMTVDCLRAGGGKVATTLPFSDETKNRRKEVDLEFTLLYWVLGKAMRFANAIDFPAMPNEHARMLAYCRDEAPAILPKIKPQKLRKMPGGLEKVEEGLRVMEKGDYSAEKIVYSLE